MSLGGIQLVRSQKMTKIWTVVYNFLKSNSGQGIVHKFCFLCEAVLRELVNLKFT